MSTKNPFFMAIQKTWKELSRELFKIFPMTCDVPACLPACLPAYATGSAMASVTPDAQVGALAGVGVGALTGAMGSLVVLPNYFSSIFKKY